MGRNVENKKRNKIVSMIRADDTFIMEALIFSDFMDMNGFYGSIREDGET